VFDAITKHIREGEKIMPKAREILGEDDPVYERLESAIKTYETAYESIKSFFHKGKTIEAFDIESIDNFPQHIFRIKNCVPYARILTYRNAFPILMRYGTAILLQLKNQQEEHKHAIDHCPSG
jgi:hypothetical protein